ncbi:MAG: FAD-dependent oxidoreductase [Candidatus Eremiobacteraeota bacterium]|nr:FAD-dependent oxidoreductase [Candidatus Eremiobacteraeota bacterium]
MDYDVVIVGGSFGGCAAALAAAAGGHSTCLIESSGWLGGQYSAQGVTKPDETSYTPTVGSTATYRNFQHAVRAFYRNNYTLSSSGAAQPVLDPGGDYPGFSTEPLVAHNMLLQQLQAAPLLHVRLNLRVTAASVSGDTVQSVTAVDANGVATTFTARYFLDATDLGDLIALAGVEHVIGAEARADTNEPDAASVAHPDWIQPITMVVALERRPDGENHTIAKPANYDELKAQQNYTIVDGYIKKMFAEPADMWGYRRHIRASNFDDPTFPADLSMINMGANDYQGATIPSGDAGKDEQIVEAARQASLGYVYWLQTEVPRDDGSGYGYPNLKVRPDQFGSGDGTSAQPYVRESRRIKALYTVVQQDLDQSHNPGPRAKNYGDSCGIGDYGALDIHALRGVGMPGAWIPIRPFEIPLRALIPIRVNNLLAACKNIGTTHVTNGAYRLHPVEWNVGEAAGMLTSFALNSNVLPRAVAMTETTLRSFQKSLLARGVPIFWWTDVHFGDAWFAAAHLLGVAGVISGENAASMNFQPNDPFGDGAKAAVESNLGRSLNWPSSPLTRAQAAQWIVSQLGWGA